MHEAHFSLVLMESSSLSSAQDERYDCTCEHLRSSQALTRCIISWQSPFQKLSQLPLRDPPLSPRWGTAEQGDTTWDPRFPSPSSPLVLLESRGHIDEARNSEEGSSPDPHPSGFSPEDSKKVTDGSRGEKGPS